MENRFLDAECGFVAVTNGKQKRSPRQDQRQRSFAVLNWFMALAFFIALSASAAQAQVADIHGGGPLNTAFNSGATASGTVSSIGTGGGPGGWETAQFDLDYSVTGVSTWNGGIQFQIQDGVQQLWTQNQATDLSLSAPASASTGDFALSWTRGVAGLTFYHGGLDNDDGALIQAFYQGNPVTLLDSYFSDFTTGVSLVSNDGTTAFVLGVAGGSGDERAREYKITFPDNVLVDQVTFVTGKEDGRAGNVTLAFYLFDWLPLTIDAEDDTGPTVSNGSALTGVVNVLEDNGAGVDTLDDPNTAGVDAATASTVTVAATGVLPTGVTLNADGTVDLAVGIAPGPLSIPYEICEIANPTNCAPATLTLTITDNPATADDSESSPTIEPVTVDVLDNDTPAGSPLDETTVELTATGAPAGSTLTDAGKTLTVPGEGVWTVAATGEITFTPESGFDGDPTPAAYVVQAVSGSTSNESTVSIDYGERPVAVDDTFESATIVPVSIDPLGNDNDGDGTLVGSTVVLTGTSAPSGSTLAGDGKTLTVPGEGVWTVAASGEVTFTPEAGLSTNPTPVSYAVNDNDGNTSNEALITVSYGTPPVATNDVISTASTGPVVFDPLTNDDAAGSIDLDPTSVVLTGTGAPAGSVLSSDGKSLTVPGEGAWTVDPVTGAVTFTPEAGFTGAITPAAYTVEDENGLVSNEATLSAFIAQPAIVAVDDGVLVVDGADPVTSPVSVLDNDTLDGDPVSLTTVQLTPGAAPVPITGSIAMTADGNIAVAAGTTPGTFSYPYEICEIGNLTNCATANASIVVNSQTLTVEIEEDLVAILEEDLASTLILQSQQIGGYSADALDRLRQRSGPACLADVNARLAADNILFDTDKAIIKPESQRILNEIAEILQTCPGSAFEIAGHTDSDASDLYNIDLSQRRVDAVLRALTSRGVDTTGFVARGYGESRPIATNATEEGKAQNRRVEFLPQDAVAQAMDCHNDTTLVRKLDLNADENGATVDGAFQRENNNCYAETRSVFEGTLSYLDNGDGQEQSMVTLSYRREKFTNADRIFGYFVGVYGSRNDVSGLADGDINGAGVNAGIYAADQLNNGLYVDYYLAGAVGQHEFDLAFDRDIGTIDATGDYTYLAGFTGAALSGDLVLGTHTVTPRIGFDYVYAPESDVDVVATLDSVSQNDILSLSSLSGGRVFVEVRDEFLINNGAAMIALNPRIACYEEIGGLSGSCGIGGSVEFSSTDKARGLTYAFEIDGERGEDYTLGSLSGSVAREVGIGMLSGDVEVVSRGAVSLGTEYEIKF